MTGAGATVDAGLPPSQAVGRRTRAVFWAGVLAQSGIVVTGALVRLTGSGLGCPTWPECSDGNLVPVAGQAEGFHKLIEFGNRLLTFVLAVVLVACVVAAWRHRPRRPPLVVLALLGFLGIAGQAVLGGITVLTELHPMTVAAHFLLSVVLIAVAVALLERGDDRGDGPPQPVVRRELRLVAGGLVVLGVVVLALGTVVTGSGPHSGDADAPARFGFDARTVSWLHADAVLLFVGLVAALVLGLVLTDAPERLRRRAWFLVAVVLAQGALGYLQFFTDLPWLLVAVHVLGACVVWVAVLRVWFATRTRDVAPSTA